MKTFWLSYTHGFKAGKAEEKKRILREFQMISLAPNDNEYFRMLVQDILVEVVTDKMVSAVPYKERLKILEAISKGGEDDRRRKDSRSRFAKGFS